MSWLPSLSTLILCKRGILVSNQNYYTYNKEKKISQHLGWENLWWYDQWLGVDKRETYLELYSVQANQNVYQ